MTQQPSRIVQENVDALIERERAGRIEHGDDMDRTDFPVEAWLAELISESLDSANYGRKLQHMLPKLVAAAKRLEGMGFAWADGSWQATCTCPSGDGSLRWPCPVHTAGVHGAVAKVGSDHFRSIVDWLGPIPPPNTLLYAAPVTASPADHLHAHLLHMLGAKDHEDAGRIIGQLHAATLRTPSAQEAVYEISHVSPMNFGGFCAQIITPTKLERGTKLYAAPVAAAPAVAYMVDGRTEQGLTFDKAAAETMAFANGGTVRALGFVEGIPAAPGIDLATAWAEGYRSGVTDERISESNIGIAGFGAKIEPARANPYLIDASLNGALNEQFGSAEGFKAHFAEFIKLGRRHVAALYNSPRDEISMTDTGCWIQYAMQLLQLDSPKGGSDARDAARYRWLREFAVNGSIGIPFHGWLNCDEPASEWDSAIDAAMQAGDAEVQPNKPPKNWCPTCGKRPSDPTSIFCQDAFHQRAYDRGVRRAGRQPQERDEVIERVAALLYQEATDEPWTVAGVEHDGPDRAYYRELARRVLEAEQAGDAEVQP